MKDLKVEFPNKNAGIIVFSNYVKLSDGNIDIYNNKKS